MDYPWLDKLIICAAPENGTEDTSLDSPPDEETGTNVPVNVPDDSSNPDDVPNHDLAESITDSESTDTGVESPDADIETLKTQIENLKKQIEDLQADSDMQSELEIIKKRVDNIRSLNDPDLNDSIFQSASVEISYLKRAVRRFFIRTSFSGEKRTLIDKKIEQRPQMSRQEIAAEMSNEIGVNEQDIIDYIRNSEFRFRHRNQASVIDWESI